jgi:DNA-binding NtrC family response regulator
LERPADMEQQTSLLILSRDFSLFDTVKRSSLPGNFSLFFSQPDEDFLTIVRDSLVKIVLLDSPDPGEGPDSPLKMLKKFDPQIDVILLGEEIGAESVLDWIRRGATDYIAKPLRPGTIAEVLKRISDKRTLRRETFQLEKKLEKKYIYRGIVSRSPYMHEVFAQIDNIARHFQSVLITGQTGTGKDMVARAIHAQSPYQDRELVICDCASIPENLFESELFGYRKGAFTGADRDKKGLFEEADQGVIFLDEIAEIPVAVQAKLLRVLENHQFRPLGTNENRSIDVRVIAATNRDLPEAIRNNTFREDLYHRLNRVEIRLPPLRERLEDIPLLVRHFVQNSSRDFSKELRGVSRDVQKIFLKYDWPGNVRELENVLQSAAMLCKKDFIETANLPKYLRDLEGRPGLLPFLNKDNLSTLENLEKDYIIYLLKVTNTNLRRTSQILGISRTTLYNKMAKFNLSR